MGDRPGSRLLAPSLPLPVVKSFDEIDPVFELEQFVPVCRGDLAAEAEDVDHRRVRRPAEFEVASPRVEVENERVMGVVVAEPGVIEFRTARARQINPRVTDPVVGGEVTGAVLLKVGMVGERWAEKDVSGVEISLLGPSIGSRDEPPGEPVGSDIVAKRARERIPGHTRGILGIVGGVHVNGQSDLAKVALARGHFRTIADGADNGNENRCQNPDDGDYSQKLDQSESGGSLERMTVSRRHDTEGCLCLFPSETVESRRCKARMTVVVTQCGCSRDVDPDTWKDDIRSRQDQRPVALHLDCRRDAACFSVRNNVRGNLPRKLEAVLSDRIDKILMVTVAPWRGWKVVMAGWWRAAPGWLWLLLTVLGAVPLAAIPAEEVNAPMSDAELLARMDLDQPGLEAVRAAVASEDLETAKAELAAHFRSRSGVFHYVDAQNPTAGISNPGGKIRGAMPLVNRTGEWGQHLWTGNLFNWGAANLSNQWRMYFLESLGEAAALEAANGSEEYPIGTSVVYLIRSFIHLYPNGGDGEGGVWSTMNVGIRLRTGWPVAFLSLLSSPAFTDEDIVLFLKSVWDQSDYLRRNLSDTSNWLTFELAGLYTSGVVYPEFKDAESWRRIASETVLGDLDRGWLPDGMTIELSPGYGQFFSNYFVIYELARHAGRLEEFGMDAFPARTEPLFEAYLKIMAPNRLAPATNDNTPADVVSILREGLEWFPHREDFRWVVTQGGAGTPPAYTSMVLPYAGFAVMRESWATDANLLYFDFGPVGYRHAHQDGLSLQLWAYGRPVLFDPGLSNYDHSLPMVNYVMDTFSHNTVLIDNRPQRRLWYNNPHPNRMPYEEVPGYRWRTTERYDLAAGKYEEAYGLSGPSDAYPYSAGSNFRQGWVYPARHYRRVFYLKPDLFFVADTLVPIDGLPHEYEARWHLDTVNWRTEGEGERVVTEDPGQPNLEMVSLFPEGLDAAVVSGQLSPEILGWNAGNPLNPKPAATVRHRKSGSSTVRFLTLLAPLRPGVPSLVRHHERLRTPVVAVELVDGRRLVVEAPSDPAHDLAVHLPGDSGGGFDVWRALHFSLEERNDLTVSGGEAAPAGDGIPNLLKYAVGLVPYASAGAGLPKLGVYERDGDAYLSLSIVLAAGVEDVTCSAEVFGALGASAEPAIRARETRYPDGTKELVFRDDVSMHGQERRFMRLRLTAQY